MRAADSRQVSPGRAGRKVVGRRSSLIAAAFSVVLMDDALIAFVRQRRLSVFGHVRADVAAAVDHVNVLRRRCRDSPLFINTASSPSRKKQTFTRIHYTPVLVTSLILN